MSLLGIPTDTALDDETIGDAGAQVRRANARRPFIDIRDLLIALKRRHRVLLALGAVGMATGIGLSLLQPPQFSATTTLLLSHPSGVDPAHSIQTDADLLEARGVARAAVKSLGLHESPDALLLHYSGAVVSDDLLAIRASAGSQADATRMTNTIAREYLAFRKQVYERQLKVTIAALESRKASLETELASLTASIGAAQGANSGGSTTGGASPLADQLVTRSADVSADLAFVRSAILNATDATTQRISGSGIVDPANAVESSRLKGLVRNAATGLAGGLFLGVGLVVFLAAISDRAWRRADVASALQAPVAQSIRSMKIPGPTPLTRLRTNLEAPSGELEQVARYLRSSIELESGREASLAVVSVDSVQASALIVGALALDLAREGAQVLLVDFSAESALSELLNCNPGAPAAAVIDPSPGTIRIVDPRAASAVARGGSVDAAPPAGLMHPSPGVVLVLAELDPAFGAQRLRSWTSGAVVVVTAARSAVGTLVSTAEMLRAAAIEVRSAVLVGADRYDDTFGQVLNADSQRVADADPVSPKLSAHWS
jgi:capsular polysaccharide biosynthesis protein